MTEEERTNFRRHVVALSRFAHRGSATECERQAAAYLVDELDRIGIAADLVPFRGSSSWGCRHLIHIVVALPGLVFLWMVPAVTVALGLVAFLSFWAEGETRGIWLSRVFVNRWSANIVGKLASQGQAKSRIVICAH